MMEKEQHDSMATVQMKADYAASEVYSTTSEPPPVRYLHYWHYIYYTYESVNV